MMLGAAHFSVTRNGFYFTAAGAELPIVWTVLLILQSILDEGPYALRAGQRLK
jgi:putative oxidoreductase